MIVFLLKLKFSAIERVIKKLIAVRIAEFKCLFPILKSKTTSVNSSLFLMKSLKSGCNNRSTSLKSSIVEIGRRSINAAENLGYGNANARRRLSASRTCTGQDGVSSAVVLYSIALVFFSNNFYLFTTITLPNIRYLIAIFTFMNTITFEQCSSITEVGIFETFLGSFKVSIGYIGGSVTKVKYKKIKCLPNGPEIFEALNHVPSVIFVKLLYYCIFLFCERKPTLLSHINHLMIYFCTSLKEHVKTRNVNKA
ncbi:hypothetical protein AGLY_016691 [Aphis glycines]|uniref:Uncharacterized protein n=1 Tax=Aphis glycines TaxID=307491 RepID=A0A6G0SWV6_APHGL|nr:hypothetical protein AGLY_016691 [Aphis glycines]